jgi:hypothetical protein
MASEYGYSDSSFDAFVEHANAMAKSLTARLQAMDDQTQSGLQHWIDDDVRAQYDNTYKLCSTAAEQVVTKLRATADTAEANHHVFRAGQNNAANRF